MSVHDSIEGRAASVALGLVSGHLMPLVSIVVNRLLFYSHGTLLRTTSSIWS